MGPKQSNPDSRESAKHEQEGEAPSMLKDSNRSVSMRSFNSENSSPAEKHLYKQNLLSGMTSRVLTRNNSK